MHRVKKVEYVRYYFKLRERIYSSSVSESQEQGELLFKSYKPTVIGAQRFGSKGELSSLFANGFLDFCVRGIFLGRRATEAYSPKRQLGVNWDLILSRGYGDRFFNDLSPYPRLNILVILYPKLELGAICFSRSAA